MTLFLRNWQIVVAAAALSILVESAPAAEFQIHREQARVAVAAGDRQLLVYRFDAVPMKPYAAELCTPAGIQVLRDAPADHKHHHGLMLALGVDGIDFWSENEKCGRQIHESFTEVKSGAEAAEFTETLHWTGPGEAGPLATERRSIRLRVADGIPATLLTWKSQLAPAEGRKSITLGGSHYFGLGLRLVESMDKVGRFFNPEDKQGQVVRGQERLTPVRWMAYSAPVDGKPVTVALFDSPTNARHPARFFTMPAPFAYLSATLNLWKEPLEVPADRPLVLCYGVVVCDGAVSAVELDKLYRSWVAGLGDGPTTKRDTAP